MKLFAKLDYYFLSDDPEEITMSDRFTFYGTYGLVFIMCLYVAANIY